MSSHQILIASLFAVGFAGTAAPARAQGCGTPTSDSAPSRYDFRSRKDSLDWARNKKAADNSKGFRILVSLEECHLWVVDAEDTLLSAPAAVASGRTLRYQGSAWTFEMPRGRRTVLGKDADPIWTPPVWLYYEAAHQLGLTVREIPAKGLTMPDGRRLYVNSENEIGVITKNGPEKFVDKNLHLIFGNVLYVPPVGTENRRVNGTLGKYKLDLGEGFLFHGTPLKNSIGLAATHGCVRLRDEDIEWLYESVPLGTKVYVY